MTGLKDISGAGDHHTQAKQNSEIELASGRYLDLLNPRPSLITLSDVAHHLAQCNRYAGACKRPMSVAEHAILVSQRLESLGAPWPVVLIGLHHDDGEGFTHDLTRPIKDIVRPLYDPVESSVWLACAAALKLPTISIEESETVKAADNWALAKEAHFLMKSGGRGWWCWGLYDPEDPSQNTLPLTINPDREMMFIEMREAYKKRHRYIMRRIG
jgi:hypothetical protein